MFGSPSFTAADIPDQTGRVIFVTGGNTGLGKESITQLAKKNAKLYMASRTESKALAAIEDIKKLVPSADIHYVPLDLTSFASIRACASTFIALEPRLHVLLNNAGVMAMPYSETTEGYEIQFGTNHVGHFLLTSLLLPALEAAADAPDAPAGSVRIVNLSSFGHNFAYRGIKLDDLQNHLKNANTGERYGVSKLANILHARELARRYPKITSVSLHPGIIMSDLYNAAVGSNPIMKMWFNTMSLVCTSVPDGTLNQLFCATGPVKPEDSGHYYVPVGIKDDDAWYTSRPSKLASDDALASRLWEWSEEQVRKHAPISS
ncbi:oxidoreductase [Tricharina praecox]|uniref:oxidoreductase n=1 Tax=Tricharina praecox TaxID=43433 RepID=UPI00221FBA50|nr:oxidoreductase [Tricharina praecox]KAI5849155.1 oxidoreductase [Tricharina praecox]